MTTQEILNRLSSIEDWITDAGIDIDSAQEKRSMASKKLFELQKELE